MVFYLADQPDLPRRDIDVWEESNDQGDDQVAEIFRLGFLFFLSGKKNQKPRRAKNSPNHCHIFLASGLLARLVVFHDPPFCSCERKKKAFGSLRQFSTTISAYRK